MSKQTFINAVRKNIIENYVPIAVITTAVTVEMMEKSGVYWPDAHKNAEDMAVLGAMAHELYGFENVKIPFDVAIEVEAIGLPVNFGSIDTYPQVPPSSHIIPDAFKVPENLAESGRIPVILDAISILKKRYPDTALVCHAMGPFSIMSMLFGFGNILEWIINEDLKYPKAMEMCTCLSNKYTKLLDDAGADIIQYGEAAASGEVLGAHMYEDCVAPYHKNLSNHLKAPTVLHICGNITNYLKILPSLGIDAISFDHKVDIKNAREIMGNSVKTVGNIDTLEVLLEGAPEDVERAVFKCLEDGIHVLNPGCSLAPRMKGENLKAMVEAAKKFESTKGITIKQNK